MTDADILTRAAEYALDGYCAVNAIYKARPGRERYWRLCGFYNHCASDFHFSSGGYLTMGDEECLALLFMAAMAQAGDL